MSEDFAADDFIADDFVADDVKRKQPRTLQQFRKNALEDYKQNAESQALIGSYAFPPLALMQQAQGRNIYDPSIAVPVGEGVLKGIAMTPVHAANTVLHPINSMYEKPLSTPLDIVGTIGLAGMGAKALKPMVTSRVLEATSGLAPNESGVLQEAYKDPTLLFAKNKKNAGPLYEAARNEEAAIFKGRNTNKKVVDAAETLLDMNIPLEPSEALTARKAVDQLIDTKQGVKDNLIPLRKKLDKIAKSDPLIAEADKITARGIKGEALRTPYPRNIKGTFSSWRTAGAGAAAAMLPVIGKLAAGYMASPLAQGAVASGAGALAPLATPATIGSAEAASAKESLAAMQKPLTEEIAREFLREAYKRTKDEKEARKQARERAIREGYKVD